MLMVPMVQLRVIRMLAKRIVVGVIINLLLQWSPMGSRPECDPTVQLAE